MMNRTVAALAAIAALAFAGCGAGVDDVGGEEIGSSAQELVPGWSVNLVGFGTGCYLRGGSGSTLDCWNNRPVTLMANSNNLLMPGLFLSIWEVNASNVPVQRLAYTTIGAMVQVTAPAYSNTEKRYRAYVSLNLNDPRIGTFAESTFFTANTQDYIGTINFSASPTTNNLGVTSVLTLNSTYNIKYSGKCFKVIDDTFPLGFAMSAQGYDSSSFEAYIDLDQPLTHQFTGLLGPCVWDYNGVGGQQFVTWSNVGYRVSLNWSAGYIWAQTNSSVANGYSIQIFHVPTHTRVANCTSGSTCYLYSFQPGWTDYVAFVSTDQSGSNYPPLNTAANSIFVRH